MACQDTITRSPLSTFQSSYLTAKQVHWWIRYRTLLDAPDPTSSADLISPDGTISDWDLKALQDAIAAKAISEESVDALLQLLAALATGRVKATGRLNELGKPRLLPAHYWAHLTLTNRYTLRGGIQTCACFKNRLNGELWSDLRFDAKRVLTVWPPSVDHNEQRSEEIPIADERPQRRLRPASSSKIDNTISEVYDEAERAGLKPPNVKEIVAPVQKKLNNEGYEASGRQIQKLAEHGKHKSRRRSPGPTMAREMTR